MVVIKAIFMSMTCAAIHVFAPDHLGTLLMLSALTSPREAFKIGASWGVGHSAGMILICALFLCLKTLADKHLKLWEHIGEYCVGASMMLVALYFFCKESQYLHRNDDGTVEAVPCACHHIHVSARQQRMASPHFKMNSPDCRSRSHNPDTFPPPPEHSLQSTDVHATQIARPVEGLTLKQHHCYSQVRVHILNIIAEESCQDGAVSALFLLVMAEVHFLVSFRACAVPQV